MSNLNAYSFHDGEPVDGAVLVFAPSFREAKKIAYPSVRSFTDCDFIQVQGRRIWRDAWLKDNAANQRKLAAGEAHVIESPPCCQGCELWHDELFDGYCESCAEEREEVA